MHSVAELIALAKSKPGQVLHATVMGSLPHLASELFAQRAGIKLMQVPYQGSPQTVTDVIAGRVMMTFSPASTVVGQIAAGKLMALATAANKRSSALPNVPTMAEAGIPDFDTSRQEANQRHRAIDELVPKVTGMLTGQNSIVTSPAGRAATARWWGCR